MTNFDRKLFFDEVRQSLFNGKLSTSQVEGLEVFLAYAEKVDTPVDHLAYILATAYHEVDRTMQPIKEKGGDSYFFRMYDIEGNRPHVARDLGNTRKGDGVKYAGRGYVQLTGRNNYQRASTKLNLDLVNNPDFALDPVVAAEIIFVGMTEGWFTGRKLQNYFTENLVDPVNARQIVNRLDRASDIAEYYQKFKKALEISKIISKTYVPELQTTLEERVLNIEIFLQRLKEVFNGL